MNKPTRKRIAAHLDEFLKALEFSPFLKDYLNYKNEDVAQLKRDIEEIKEWNP